MQQTDEELFKNNAEMMNIRLLSQYTDTAVKYRWQGYKQAYNQFYNLYYFQKSAAQCKRNDSLQIKQIASLDDYLKKLPPTSRKNLIESALNMARSADSFLTSKVTEEENQIADQAKLTTEWHNGVTG